MDLKVLLKIEGDKKRERPGGTEGGRGEGKKREGRKEGTEGWKRRGESTGYYYHKYTYVPFSLA